MSPTRPGHPVTPSTATHVRALADEIQRYLSAHPNAADSREGVLRWWLTRQRVEEAADGVQLALDYLAEQGRVVRTVLPDGQVVYASASAAPQKKP